MKSVKEDPGFGRIGVRRQKKTFRELEPKGK